MLTCTCSCVDYQRLGQHRLRPLSGIEYPLPAMVNGRLKIRSCYQRYYINVLCSLCSLSFDLSITTRNLCLSSCWLVCGVVCSTNSSQTTDLSLQGRDLNGMGVHNDLFYVNGVRKKNLNLYNPLLPFVTLLLGALSP